MLKKSVMVFKKPVYSDNGLPLLINYPILLFKHSPIQ